MRDELEVYADTKGKGPELHTQDVKPSVAEPEMKLTTMQAGTELMVSYETMPLYHGRVGVVDREWVADVPAEIGHQFRSCVAAASESKRSHTQQQPCVSVCQKTEFSTTCQVKLSDRVGRGGLL